MHSQLAQALVNDKFHLTYQLAKTVAPLFLIGWDGSFVVSTVLSQPQTQEHTHKGQESYSDWPTAQKILPGSTFPRWSFCTFGWVFFLGPFRHVRYQNTPLRIRPLATKKPSNRRIGSKKGTLASSHSLLVNYAQDAID
jgi:hypothetical protein